METAHEARVVADRRELELGARDAARRARKAALASTKARLDKETRARVIELDRMQTELATHEKESLDLQAAPRQSGSRLCSVLQEDGARVTTLQKRSKTVPRRRSSPRNIRVAAAAAPRLVSTEYPRGIHGGAATRPLGFGGPGDRSRPQASEKATADVADLTRRLRACRQRQAETARRAMLRKKNARAAKDLAQFERKEKRRAQTRILATDKSAAARAASRAAESAALARVAEIEEALSSSRAETAQLRDVHERFLGRTPSFDVAALFAAARRAFPPGPTPPTSADARSFDRSARDAFVSDLFEELHVRQAAAAQAAAARTPEREDDLFEPEHDDVSRLDDASRADEVSRLEDDVSRFDEATIASGPSVRSRDASVATEPSRRTYATAETAALPPRRAPDGLSFASREDRSFASVPTDDDDGLVLDARRTAAKRGETPYRKGGKRL